MSGMSSYSDWEQIAADPHPERDLGYEMLDWDVVKANNRAGHLIFLPRDDDYLREDAFIVADAASVCDVRDRV